MDELDLFSDMLPVATSKERQQPYRS